MIPEQIGKIFDDNYDFSRSDSYGIRKRVMSKEKFIEVVTELSDAEEEKPDLTYIWNLAEKKSRGHLISFHDMNEIWGALNILEKQGFIKLADREDP